MDLTKGAPLPQLLLVLRQYQIKYKKEIEVADWKAPMQLIVVMQPELKIHDKLWTTHQNAMTDQHKATHNTQKPQLTSGAGDAVTAPGEGSVAGAAAESAADGTPAEEFPVIAEPSQADQVDDTRLPADCWLALSGLVIARPASMLITCASVACSCGIRAAGSVRGRRIYSVPTQPSCTSSLMARSSQMALRDRIAEHKVRRREDLRV